ncbi:uncharacterized protein LOC118753727 [Rhagoletis pomonella]|uniref:uncharacterized protein LOC118753593 n=1 Tax=Rhagoletis pomonella TaxID=28610 RepID=UPI00177DFCD2|nr:uncharacterized protein LOC118753593 [Rhagoletis pomonella]XP_036344486.1 uncharacterized protein LOC118753727 [Rhagoletis pomonella]
MLSIKLFVSCVLLVVSYCRAESPEFDCQRPPRLVDPTLCCKDGGYDQTTEVCGKRMGIIGKGNHGPPTVEKATCFAECILRELHYIQEPEKLNYETMQTDMQAKYGNDTVFVDTMMGAFRKCEPDVQQKLQAFKQMTLLGAAAALRRGCSPFSGMLLGCTYMEYFKNCPAHRWTETKECALAKRFVTQCALGVKQT